MNARIPLMFLGLACLYLGCDWGEEEPKVPLAERKRLALAKKATPVVDAHAAAFASVAEWVAASPPTEQACPADVAASLGDASWVDAPSIGLSERALVWFAETPRTPETAAETRPAWAEGSEGVLNDNVLSDPTRNSIDGARVSLLRDLWQWSRHGPTPERLTGILSNRLSHKFDSDDPPGPRFVVVVRGLEIVEPTLPEVPKPPELDSIEALLAGVPNDEATPATPDFRIDPAAAAKSSFIGGTIAGWIEVYDVAGGRRLCGHKIEAKSSAKFRAFHSRDEAVPADLGYQFIRAANAVFAHRVATLPAGLEALRER